MTTTKIKVRDGCLMNLVVIQTAGENSNLDLEFLLQTDQEKTLFRKVKMDIGGKTEEASEL